MIEMWEVTAWNIKLLLDYKLQKIGFVQTSSFEIGLSFQINGFVYLDKYYDQNAFFNNVGVLNFSFFFGTKFLLKLSFEKPLSLFHANILEMDIL